MEIEFRGKEITLDKELNILDKLVIDFCSLLNSLGINYVIISGYVSIVFGRTRTTEDIDLFMEKLTKENFSELYKLLKDKGYWFVNTDSDEDAFEMLTEGLAIRAAPTEYTAPNFEIKFAKNSTDFYSLQNRLKLLLGKGQIFISPIEMHIAYKLYLGSHKDAEDAYHVYKLLKKYIDLEELKRLIKMLGVEEKAKKELGDLYGN